MSALRSIFFLQNKQKKESRHFCIVLSMQKLLRHL